jgi:hypothetical protein
MTQDEIIKLVEDNGLTLHGDIEHFAALVASAERETCAKVCEQHGYDHYCGNVTDKLAETIRARGQV